MMSIGAEMTNKARGSFLIPERSLVLIRVIPRPLHFLFGRTERDEEEKEEEI